MSAQHTPGPKFRKPGERAARGLSNIRSEMGAIADDLSTYEGPSSVAERDRARDIRAGLAYIDAAIAKATGAQS